MTEELSKQKFSDDKLLNSKSFRAFIPYYVIYFNSQERKFAKYGDGVLSMKDKGEYAMKQLSGTVLDYAMARVIELGHKTLTSTAFTFWTSQLFDAGLQEYLSKQYYATTIENDLTLAKAKEEAEKKKANPAKAKGGLPTLMDLNGAAFTFDKFKGKVIYVDFWASWCGPCRAEFPNSKKMHESLSDKQKQEVVFLYISIDQDLAAWEKAVEKLGLKEFGENAHSFDVAATYQVATIPRYMIVDKTGKIVDNQAPRPSNPETLGKLLDLLR